MFDERLFNEELAREQEMEEQEELERIRQEGSVLLTDAGLVEGWFVGFVEYPVAGDPINGFETTYGMAFMMKANQRVFRAEKIGNRWHLENPNRISGLIEWDVYPLEWPEYKKAPESLKREHFPKKAPERRLSDFLDSPTRTDAGMSLFVVKSWHNQYGHEVYVGHNRKVAAKKMKEIRSTGHRCTVQVYPVHKQDQYNTLPF